MRIAFDSNLLIYLARVWKSQDDPEKTGRLRSVMRALRTDVTIVVPYQAFGEAYRVMLRFGYSRSRCRETLLDWAEAFATAESSSAAFVSAIDLATDHKLQFWDALIISVAAEAGCALLLSEDLQPGFSWHGATVVNPLAETLDERLVRLLDAPQ